jgi:hypothetical protein
MKTTKRLSSTSASPLVRVLWIVLPFAALLTLILPLSMGIASLSYFLMVSGLIYRQERMVHVRLMTAAIAIDVLLVLTLEITKSAVETAASLKLIWPQQMHIGFSLLAVLFYIPVVYLGRKRFLGKATTTQKNRHLKMGITAFVFRTIGYIFMFSMLMDHYQN